MKNLYELLINKEYDQSFIKTNIHKFVFLNDNEIEKLFNEDKINDEYKTFIVETCYNRINKLPNQLFIKILNYIENKDKFIKNYLPRISELNYEELITLIYDNVYNEDCLIEIANSELFINYKQKEIEEGKRPKLQCFEIITKLYLNENNIENSSEIGKEIVSLVKINPKYTDEIMMIIDRYLETIITNKSLISIDSIHIANGIELIRDCLRKTFLTPKLLEFYIMYRTKELCLEEYLEGAIISSYSGHRIPGEYAHDLKKIIIYNENIKKIFKPVIDEMRNTSKLPINEINDILADNIFHYIVNQYTLQLISHELGHVVEHKKIDIFYKLHKENKLNLDQNSFSTYYLHNLALHIQNEDNYQLNHDNFISENRADLFAIMDFAIQANKNFKNCISDERLINISAFNAEKIVELYTEKTEKGRKITSPVEKFIDFHNQNLNNSQKLSFIDSSSQEIITNLFLGNPIPKEIIIEINKIAIGEVKTTNLYSEILKIIQDYQKQMEDNKQK